MSQNMPSFQRLLAKATRTKAKFYNTFTVAYGPNHQVFSIYGHVKLILHSLDTNLEGCSKYGTLKCRFQVVPNPSLVRPRVMLEEVGLFTLPSLVLGLEHSFPNDNCSMIFKEFKTYLCRD